MLLSLAIIRVNVDHLCKYELFPSNVYFLFYLYLATCVIYVKKMKKKTFIFSPQMTNV